MFFLSYKNNPIDLEMQSVNQENGDIRIEFGMLTH